MRASKNTKCNLALEAVGICFADSILLIASIIM